MSNKEFVCLHCALVNKENKFSKYGSVAYGMITSNNISNKQYIERIKYVYNS